MPEATASELRLELRQRDVEIAALKSQIKGLEAAVEAAARLLRPYLARIGRD